MSNENEQIPPEELDQMQIELSSNASKAFSQLTSSSAEERRLAAIKLRRLSDRGAGLSYSVSKEEADTLLKQIEKESSIASQVAEISALNEVNRYASDSKSKKEISDLLKKLISSSKNLEVTSESQYTLHLIENGTEANGYVAFKEMGLKKEDFITNDMMFAHAVYEFTYLNSDSLVSQSDTVVPALKKLLSTSKNPVHLVEGLHIASLLGSKAEPIYSTVLKLVEYPFWRVRKESIHFLHYNSETKLLSAEAKKKIKDDIIPEVSGHLKLLNIK